MSATAGLTNVTAPRASVPMMPSPAAPRMSLFCFASTERPASARMSANVRVVRTNATTSVSVARITARSLRLCQWSTVERVRPTTAKPIVRASLLQRRSPSLIVTVGACHAASAIMSIVAGQVASSSVPNPYVPLAAA